MKLVGKIKEAHGLKGEVYVIVFAGDVSWLAKLKSFGIGVMPARGSAPPADAVQHVLDVQKAKPFKQGLILKAAEWSDRNQAEAVVGQGFYVPEELFVSEDGETIYLGEILEFDVVDLEGEVLGRIVDFSSNGVQDLLVLKTDKGTAEVPFVDAFLRRIDFDKRTVVMELPEGLLELSGTEER